MGKFPCPKCLIPKDMLHKLGTPVDEELRRVFRVDDEKRQEKINQARRLIYEQGYVVNSQRVDAILGEESLVPTNV
jgi:hypothetical protein